MDLMRYPLLYICSHLENRKHCFNFNNINSKFQTMGCSVAQVSIVGPILCNIFFNDCFFFLCNVFVHIFIVDNTLYSFGKTVNNLLSILEVESDSAVNCTAWKFSKYGVFLVRIFLYFVWIKIATFFKRRVSIILRSFSS